jgi:hypothetical protein
LNERGTTQPTTRQAQSGTSVYPCGLNLKIMKLIKLTKLNFDYTNQIEESIYYVNVETISTIKTHTKVTNDKPIGEYTLISWVNTTSSQWWVKEDLEGIVAFINK